jgi:HD-GYP domain-containing protein (c-di-GMP phosphodiesterase class II)
MLANEQLDSTTLEVGKAIPCALYDAGGMLLLDAGTIIESQQQLDSLMKRGPFRAVVETMPTELTRSTAPNPFKQLDTLTEQLHQAFLGIQKFDPRSEQRIIQLATQVQALCEQDADALIGTVHIYQDTDYVSTHPIHVAILAEIFSTQMGISAERRRVIVCAALTANIAIMDLQTHLHNQPSELSESQQSAMHQHPAQAVALLRRAGISNVTWLKAVLQHHERIDGRGYPQKLRGSAICLAAKIIALSDIYSAMVVSKGYRVAHPVNNILRSIFINKGKEYDEALCLNMIKMLGVFPPGSIVILKNGETAVVTHRCQGDTVHPKVASLLSVAGAPYIHPIHRDTHNEAFRIRDMCAISRRMPLDLAAIWNYQ